MRPDEELNTLSMRPPAPGRVRTADPVALASAVIDSGEAGEPTNRSIDTLTEIEDGLAIVESFSHVYALDTGDGLLCVDASGPQSARSVVSALRSWSTAPVSHLVYTHGHVDHVGGSGAFAADAADRGHRMPTVLAHHAVRDRFARYRDTTGYNAIINLRQFSGRAPEEIDPDRLTFLPEDVLWPTVTYDTRTTLRAGDTLVEVHHGKGETDDHSWLWIPERRTLCTGDFMTWVFPNAGNPQKVQRYPREWAAVLRTLQSYDADLLLPAHGLPIRGRARIGQVLSDVATVLEELVADTLAAMNAGLDLDAVLREVKVRPEMLARPWLAATYDEPEFVVRNIWRLYGGWWDQDPAHLKPSPRARLGAEVAALAGGVAALTARAAALAAEGDLRLAAHLIEFAAAAEPASPTVHGVRAEIYAARRAEERSLMSKGVFGAAARASRAVAEGAAGGPTAV